MGPCKAFWDICIVRWRWGEDLRNTCLQTWWYPCTLAVRVFQGKLDALIMIFNWGYWIYCSIASMSTQDKFTNISWLRMTLKSCEHIKTLSDELDTFALLVPIRYLNTVFFSFLLSAVVLGCFRSPLEEKQEADTFNIGYCMWALHCECLRVWLALLDIYERNYPHSYMPTSASGSN